MPEETDYLQIDELPELRKPTFIATFRGWNDAAESASLALRRLIDGWSAKQFAAIDPEEFFDFTVARPMIRITEEGQRDLQWPSNRFYYRKTEDGQGDVVLILGTEPHLKWRTFAQTILDLYRRLEGRRLVTMGALVALTTHTRPPPITGFATEEELRLKLEAFTITRSRYQGPTGVVGMLHDAWRRAEAPAASIWAASPSYLGDATNPKAALALLQSLDRLFGFVPDLTELEEASRKFENQVDEALANNDQMRGFVAELEKRIDSGVTEAATPDLPPAGDLIGDLEEYLRRQRDDG